MGCIQAFPGLIAAMPKTTAVVMAAITMSSDLRTNAKIIATIPINVTIPATLNGKKSR
jgi:hypothetical protein